MAAGKLASLFADIRGPVGELTFSRGPGGPTIRQRTAGDQPNTEQQQAVRNTLADLANAWSSILTEDHRNTWRAYARTNPRPSRWGQLTQVSGYLAFIRHNSYHHRYTEALLRLGAPTAAPIHPPMLGITIGRPSLTATISLPPEGYADQAQDLHLYIFTGIPFNDGRHYYRGPWKLWTVIEPPTSVQPGVIETPWTWPLRTAEPQYAWPQDQLGRTIAYAIAQDNTTGALSTRATLFPTVFQE